MKISFIEAERLEEFKDQIINEIQNLQNFKQKKFLKSSELRTMLGGISAAKLQSIRVNGHLPAIKVDGMWLYDYDDVIEFMEKSKLNTGGKDDE